MDSKANSYTETTESLLLHFKNLVESHLALLYMNLCLGEENQNLNQIVEEIRTLRGIIPICAWCKGIRDDDGYWHNVETYITSRTEAQFSHGICPECVEEMPQ